MKTVRSIGLAAGLAMPVILLLSADPLEGTLKYKKDTGKNCSFCHSSVPEPGDEDPKLNREGRKFKENGHKLTEDQKKSPN